MEFAAYGSHLISNNTTAGPTPLENTSILAGKTWEPVLSITLLYGAVLLTYASKSFNSFRQNHGLLVATHAISNLVELAQYYTHPSRYPNGSGTQVPVSSLLLCLLQVHTNFALVRKLKRGNPALVRTTYQAAGILRAAIMIGAFFLQSRTLYHDSIVIIHAFVYARFIIWLFTIRQYFPDEELSELDHLNTDSDKGLIKHLHEISGANKSLLTTPQAYTAGVYGSALIVIGHQQDEFMRKFGIAAFLITMALLMRVEQWAGDIVVGYLQGKEMVSLKQQLAWECYEIGLCRVQVVSQVDKAVRPKASKDIIEKKE
ncbi:hypothetical protein H072_2438 [Dactylellina haptotyla CBS 200.50]|uniref:Uncharacterized protein n=1 Tax=Dactylellina haptotyla (strain CBS 200.50) TaxID=1284197 RepID=S8AL83_DACHA|nr:hypothetical protein H072_2438 [Dactylellina haptotyla CBS 200.50]